MIPPAKSPGKSGEAPFTIAILSITLAGITSNEKALRSLSVLGNGAPFKNAILYLSFNPRIMANLLSWTEAPLIRFNTSAVVLSGVFLIKSADTPLDTEEAFFCCSRTALALSLFTSDLITTSCKLVFNSSMVQFNMVASFCFTSTPLILFLLYEI